MEHPGFQEKRATIRLLAAYYMPSVGSPPTILPSLSVVVVVEEVVVVGADKVGVVVAVVVEPLLNVSNTEISTFIFVWFLLLVNCFEQYENEAKRVRHIRH